MKTALLSLLFLAPLTLADSPADTTDRERRVAVALALAAADTTPTPATPRPSPTAALTVDEACGICSEDLAAARAECLRSGRPVILFVGGCHGLGSELAKAKVDASFVRADRYTADEVTPTTCPRVVVMERSASAKIDVWTLPAGVDAKRITEAVKSARQVATPPLADSGTVTVTATNGSCRLVRLADGRVVQVCPGR